MAKVVDMPKLSPTMEEGQIAVWHKDVGAQVDVDELLAEVETDKATMEFRSFDRGVLLAILAPAGSVVRLGQPVAIIGKAGEDVSALLSADGSKAPVAAAKPAPAKEAEAPAAAPAKEAEAPAATAAESDEPGRLHASPYVRKLAREQGVSLDGVTGSGPRGRIIARDLAEHSAKAPAQPTAARAPVAVDVRGSRSIPLSMMRKTIARRLTQSKQTVPHFYLSIDVEVGALVKLREQLNVDLAAGGESAKVSFNDLLIKAVALGLKRVPACNASFTEEALVQHERIDISVAVSVPDGLLTPVVRNADRKNVLQIAAEVRELAGRARDKKLSPEEMSNGTFSISNLGMFGIDNFAAVINPPEGAILAVGQVRREPVVQGDLVVPGHKLAMTLSCDHRVIDGAVGATFLKELRRILEHPTQLLVV